MLVNDFKSRYNCFSLFNNRKIITPSQMVGIKVALGNGGMTVEAARQCAKDLKEWRALVHNVTE